MGTRPTICNAFSSSNGKLLVVRTDTCLILPSAATTTPPAWFHSSLGGVLLQGNRKAVYLIRAFWKSAIRAHAVIALRSVQRRMAWPPQRADLHRLAMPCLRYIGGSSFAHRRRCEQKRPTEHDCAILNIILDCSVSAICV